jgi:hypothetical protein
MSTTVNANLTPPAIPQTDYSTVQRPSLGGEMRVYLSHKACRKLGELRVIAVDGGVTSVSVTAGGTGYTEGRLVAFSGGGGLGSIGVAHVGSGIITSIEITDTGAGYATAPTPSLGTGATFGTVTLSGTGVSTVPVTGGGTGYTDGQSITLTGGGGTGAVATANVVAGVITNVTVTTAGTGYTTAPTAAVAGSGATFGTVTLGPTLEYNYQNVPSSSTPGPILAIVKTELRANAAAVVGYCGITGTFQSALWAANKRFDFPAGKCVELIGTFTPPYSGSMPSLSNAQRGSKVVLYEMPGYSDFDEAGVTNSKRIKWPVRGSKAIANQLETGAWVVPGKTEIGDLEMTSLSSGIDDGFQRYAGLKNTVMLVNKHEDMVERERIFCLNFTPNLDSNSAEGDSEAQLTLKGMFEVGAVLVAPGTP